MSSILNILIIEDSDVDARLVIRTLERDGFELTWERVQTAEALQVALTSRTWDIVLSDYHLPGFSALSALQIVQKSPQDLPFIVVSGMIGEVAAVGMMKAGAHDYVMKDNLKRLPEAVRREIRDADVRRERNRAEAELDRAKERLQLAVDGSGIGLWDWYVQTGSLTINERWAEILGYTLADLEPISFDTWARLTHSQDLLTAQIGLEQHFKGETKNHTCEIRMRHRLGQWVWISARGKVIEWDANRKPIRMIGTHLDISHRKQAEESLQNLIAGTAATTGHDFFPALVKHIAQALYVSYAIVTQLVDEQLHVLAFWANGALQPTFSYLPARTPCERALQEGEFLCEGSVQQAFPQDLDLVEMEAYSYLGIALKDTNGKTIGNLCILDQQAIQEVQRAKKILQVFAARASAELDRQQAITQIQQLNQTLESQIEQRTAALQASEALLHQAQKVAHLGSWELDINTKRIQWSYETFRIFGRDPEQSELTYRELSQYFHPNEAEKLGRLIDRAIQFGESYEEDLQIMKADGSHAYILAKGQPTFNAEGAVTRLFGIVMDITDRKQAEKVRQESQQFLQTVLDTFPLFIFWKDQQSVYLGCNTAFAKANGLASAADIVGKTDYDLPWATTEGDAYRASDRQVMDSGLANLGIIETQTEANGSQIWLETNKLPLRNLKGEVIGVLGTYQNISARKQIETCLQETNEKLSITNQKLARATRLKDEFLANMSHELRTPLNAILGLSEGLLEEVLGSLNTQQKNALTTVERSGKHLLSLINDILDLSKIEAGKLELNLSKVSVMQLCNSSLTFVKQLAFKKQIHLNLILPELEDISVDERQMQQVLLNLLSNAVKFTPPGGQVTLEVRVEASAGSLDAQCWILFAVSDTGIGIAPDDQAKLFQPFVQIDSSLNRQYPGTGLGLALVKRIVELHGGEVRLQSELGQGSCFTACLPALCPVEDRSTLSVSPDPDPTSGAIHPPDTSQAKEALILLVEDNEANISTISNYLEAKGYRILMAHNGQEAIHMTATQHPDLILMDIQMPGMDGLEAMRQIRSDLSLASIPIIALTALVMAGDREQCLRAGANDYLTKPVKLKELVSRVQFLLAPPRK